MNKAERKVAAIYEANRQFVERVGVENLSWQACSQMARTQNMLYLYFNRRVDRRFVANWR